MEHIPDEMLYECIKTLNFKELCLLKLVNKKFNILFDLWLILKYGNEKVEQFYKLRALMKQHGLKLTTEIEMAQKYIDSLRTDNTKLINIMRDIFIGDGPRILIITGMGKSTFINIFDKFLIYSNHQILQKIIKYGTEILHIYEEPLYKLINLMSNETLFDDSINVINNLKIIHPTNDNTDYINILLQLRYDDEIKRLKDMITLINFRPVIQNNPDLINNRDFIRYIDDFKLNYSNQMFNILNPLM